MKKLISALLSLMILLVCLTMSGCSQKEELRFFTLSELDDLNTLLAKSVPAKEKEYYDKRSYEEDTLSPYFQGSDGYICLIPDDPPEELTIPETYNSKPVLAVVSGIKNREKVRRLTVSKGIVYVNGCSADELTFCGELQYAGSIHGGKAVFQERVDKINYLDVAEAEFNKDVGTFSNNYPAAERRKTMRSGMKAVHFSGNVGTVGAYAFAYYDSLQEVTADGEIGQINYCAFENTKGAKITIGGKSVMSDAVAETETMMTAIKKQLGQPLDPDRFVPEEEARIYAPLLYGPLFETNNEPDCESEAYSPQYVRKDVTVSLSDLSKLEEDYPNTMFVSGKDFLDIQSGSSPLYYCLVEDIGYGEGVTYTGNQTVYHRIHRISIRNAQNNTLEAWTTRTAGFAPGMLSYQNKPPKYFTTEWVTNPDTGERYSIPVSALYTVQRVFYS